MPQPHPQMSPEDGSSRGACTLGGRDDSGQDLAEYAILGTLIAVVLVGALTLFGNQLGAIWNTIASAIPGGGS